MRCAKCGTDNRKTAKFCAQCGAGLSAVSSKAAASPAAPEPAREAPVHFWRPDWKWHGKVLGAIYASLVVIYFVLSAFLSRVPEPFKLRDIPKEMTPWLQR